MLCYEGVKLRIGVPITIHEGRPRYRSGSQHSPKHGPRAGILSTEYSSVNPKPNVPNAERIRSGHSLLQRSCDRNHGTAAAGEAIRGTAGHRRSLDSPGNPTDTFQSSFRPHREGLQRQEACVA